MKLGGGPEEDPMKDFGHKKIYDQEDKYHQRRLTARSGGITLSPEREDPFAAPSSTSKKPSIGPNASSATSVVGVKRTYYDIITEQSLENEKADILMKIQ